MENFNRSPKFLIGGCAALTIGGIIFTWRRKNLTARIIFPIIFFTLGALRFWAVDALPPDDVSKFAGQSVQISGVIREEPQIKTDASPLYRRRGRQNARRADSDLLPEGK